MTAAGDAGATTTFIRPDGLGDEDLLSAHEWPQAGKLAAQAFVRALTRRVTLAQGRARPAERVAIEWQLHTETRH